jgi:hypothetical protein
VSVSSLASSSTLKMETIFSSETSVDFKWTTKWIFFLQCLFQPVQGPGLLFSSVIIFQTVGLLGRVISSSQSRYLHRTIQTQNKRIHTPHIHALIGIRTHDPSVRASEDSSCLRPRGYCDGHTMEYTRKYTSSTFRSFSKFKDTHTA